MISVIIPTRDRPDQLEAVLPSYLSQKDVGEIILVDDSTQAPHIEKIRGLARKNQKLVLLQDGKPSGLPASRNKGIRKASGDFIFFGEDDLELGENHFAILLAHLEKTGADIIEGRKIWKEAGETDAQAFERAKQFQGPVWDPFFLECFTERNPPDDTPTPLLLSHFLARREIFDQVLFEEDYTGFNRGFAWREETDFLMRAGQKGFTIFFCPHAVAFELPKGGGGMHHFSFWKREYWILRNHHFLIRRHQTYIRERLHNRWPLPWLLMSYGLHRLWALAKSNLYRLKKGLF